MKEKLKLILKASVAIFVIAITLCQLTQYVAGLFGVQLPEQEQVAAVRQMAGWNLNFVLIVVQIMVIMPIIEEGLFRLPTRWLRHWGWWVLISAIFSFAHYIDFVAWKNSGQFALRPLSNAFIALFFCGLGWCWLYRKAGNLWCTILSHSLFNTVNLALLFVLPESL